jgi:hypothetical protein
MLGFGGWKTPTYVPKSAKRTWLVRDRVTLETAVPPVFGKERGMGNKL